MQRQPEFDVSSAHLNLLRLPDLQVDNKALRQAVEFKPMVEVPLKEYDMSHLELWQRLTAEGRFSSVSQWRFWFVPEHMFRQNPQMAYELQVCRMTVLTVLHHGTELCVYRVVSTAAAKRCPACVCCRRGARLSPFRLLMRAWVNVSKLESDMSGQMTRGTA